MGIILNKHIANNSQIILYKIDDNGLFNNINQKKYHALQKEALFNVLEKYLGIDNASERYLKTIHNEPYIKDKKGYFSVSHSELCVAIYYCKKHHVGIDVQYKTDKVDSIRKKFLSDNELAYLSSLNADNITLLTICWTLKESIYKCFSKYNLSFIDNIRIQEIDLFTQKARAEIMLDNYTCIVNLSIDFYDKYILSYTI